MVNDPLQQGLVCEDEMPLAWAVVQSLPSAQQLAGRNVSNEALIRACEALEDTHRQPEDSSEIAHELLRIESKLNLVLELLGDWLRAQGDPPPVRAVRFNAAGIEWQGPDGPPAGANVRISFHLCQAFPKPLQLFGEVMESETANGTVRTVVRFLGVSEVVADGLERFIFRRHRREVAQIRSRERAPDEG